MRRACASVLIMVSMAAAIARGQPADTRVAEAKLLYRQARQLADKGQWLDAIAVLEEAYKRSPSTGVVFGLAYVYDRQFDKDRDPVKLRRAVELIHQYLQMPAADKLSQARQLLERLEPQLRTLDEEAARIAARAEPPPPPPPPPPAATKLIVSGGIDTTSFVALDGGTPQETPAVFETTPGRHHVVVTAPGYQPAERDLNAVKEQSLSFEIDLDEVSPKLLARTTPGARVFVDGRPAGMAGEWLAVPSGRHRVTVVRRGRYMWEREVTLTPGRKLELDAPIPITIQRRVTWYVLGAGATLLVASGVTGLLTYAAQREAVDLDRKGGPLTVDERDSYNDAIERRNTWRSTSLVLVGVGIAAVTTGALLYFIDTPRVEPGKPPPELPIVPGVGSSGLGLSWQRQF